MDGALYALFLFATFIGGLTTGFSGFAFGLVVSGLYLHLLTPLQIAILIASFGVLTQSYALWRLRRSLNWKAIWPLIAGAPATSFAGGGASACPFWWLECCSAGSCTILLSLLLSGAALVAPQALAALR